MTTRDRDIPALERETPDHLRAAPLAPAAPVRVSEQQEREADENASEMAEIDKIRLLNDQLQRATHRGEDAYEAAKRLMDELSPTRLKKTGAHVAHDTEAGRLVMDASNIREQLRKATFKSGGATAEEKSLYISSALKLHDTIDSLLRHTAEASAAADTPDDPLAVEVTDSVMDATPATVLRVADKTSVRGRFDLYRKRERSLSAFEPSGDKAQHLHNLRGDATGPWAESVVDTDRAAPGTWIDYDETFQRVVAEMSEVSPRHQFSKMHPTWRDQGLTKYASTDARVKGKGTIARPEMFQGMSGLLPKPGKPPVGAEHGVHTLRYEVGGPVKASYDQMVREYASNPDQFKRRPKPFSQLVAHKRAAQISDKWS